MDNFRDQLLRFQSQYFYLFQDRTESTLNSTVMSQSDEIQFERCPKTFAELYLFTPQCFIQLQKVRNFALKSLSSINQNKFLASTYPKLNSLLRQNKQSSIIINKNFINLISSIFSMIMSQFIDAHNGIKLKNLSIQKTLLIPMDTNLPFIFTNIQYQDAICQSMYSYMLLNQINKIWIKYLSFYFDFNRRRSYYSMLIHHLLYYSKFRDIQNQDCMKYIRFQQINSQFKYEDEVAQISTTLTCFDSIPHKQQFLNAKKQLLQTMKQIKQNKKHDIFINLIIKISQICKILNNYGKELFCKYEKKHEKLISKLQKLEQILKLEYTQINEQLPKLLLQNLKKQQLNQKIKTKIKINLSFLIKNILAIHQNLCIIQQDLVIQQKQIEKCYAQINCLFNQKEFKFYINNDQQQIIQKKTYFEDEKIMNNNIYDKLTNKLNRKSSLFIQVKNILNQSLINIESEINSELES